MLLQEIDDVDTPGYINRNNEASIYLDRNNQVSNRTKQIYTKYKFIRICVDEGTTELKNARSENNSLDIMTKNLPVETFKQN